MSATRWQSNSTKQLDEGGQSSARSVLVVDVGGTGVKILATGQDERQRFPSGPTLTPRQMIRTVKKLATGWKYDAVSIGYPGVVRQGRPLVEPYNLGRGWVDFDFQAAFECPVKLINDAAMQALGSYERGLLLFLGLGTGLGSAVVVEDVVIPMELAHLSYEKGTFEEFMGRRGLKRLGKKKWQKYVQAAIARLVAVLHPDDVVLGGGNAKKLTTMPPGCRLGSNANAFIGGFRLWESPGFYVSSTSAWLLADGVAEE